MSVLIGVLAVIGALSIVASLGLLALCWIYDQNDPANWD